MADKSLKITVVGDGAVGKTCLLTVYRGQDFPTTYIPTVMEHIQKEIIVDGVSYILTVWDTAGQEEYERLRPLAYPNTNCFLICFSVQKLIASFENIKQKWIPEIKHFSNSVPFILVGTKIDLRDSEPCYTFGQGEELGKSIGAALYLECSALKNTGIDKIFENTVKVQNIKPVSRKRRCNLL